MVVGVLNTNGSAPPVTWRFMRCEVLRFLRRDAPEQKGCNAYGSGVGPSSTREVAVVCWMTMLGSPLNAAARA